MSDTPTNTLDFHFTQSSDFKTLYASGIYTSVTPAGLINMSFYLDRQPLPDLLRYTIADNMVASESSRIIRNGIIREVQQGVLLEIQTAKNVVSALEKMIAAYEENSRNAESA